MKAISIKQPYAQWIMDGHKTLEVRSWPTTYRGDLLIHVAKYDAMKKQPTRWPRAAIVGIAELIDCRPMVPEDARAACVPKFLPDRYVFELQNVRTLIEPIPMRGTTYLFNVADEVVDLAKRTGVSFPARGILR